MSEPYFKKVISSVGWAMLILWGLMQVFDVTMVLILPVLLSQLPLSSVASEVVYQLLYGAGYMVLFMLPAVFLFFILKKKDCTPIPIAFETRLSPVLPFLVFSSLAVCFSASRVNAFMVDLFHYSEIFADVAVKEIARATPYGVVLNFIVTAIVPGLCEELLFRGAVLGNLLPFGRTNAVLISAFLFAFMHQNVEQFFYTFAMGIVLGLVYERTGSIWNGTLIHVLNNFLSVIMQSLYSVNPNSTTLSIVMLCIEGGIYLLGIISAALLVMRHFSKGEALDDGVFEKSIPAADAYAEYPLKSGRIFWLLCTPTFLLFTVLCCVQALL